MELENIFQSIILSSFAGSLIVMIIIPIKGVVKNRISCTFQYYMWMVLLIKLIIPFGIQTPLNISTITEKFYINAMIDTKKQEMQINSMQRINNKVTDGVDPVVSVNPSDKMVIYNSSNEAIKNKFTIENILCYVWMTGIVLLIIKLIIGYRKLSGIIRVTIKDIKAGHKEILNSCKNDMNIKSNVEMLYSSNISSPSLCGLFNPKILIPINAADVSDKEFKYVIMHELSHLKNKDIFINWIIALLSVIYWFNPILLYGFYKIRQDCEVHCDYKVMSYLSEGENIQYGNALIRILELSTKGKRITGAASMVMNNFEMKRRIIMISKYKKINRKSIFIGCLAVIIITALAIAINVSRPITGRDASKSKIMKEQITAKVTKNSGRDTINTNIKTDSKSATAFSSEIVIYNTHADEAYPSGRKVTDVAASVNDMLVKDGLKSSFVKCNPISDFTISYQSSRNLIINNVKDYTKDVLIDIHRDVAGNNNEGTKKIIFVLSRNSPHYVRNKEFVESLIKNMKNSSGVTTKIITYNNGTRCFNLDLSDNAALIELGNDRSSDSDIEKSINVLVSAIKSTQRVLTNQ